MGNLAKELKQLILDAKLELEMKVYKELKPGNYDYFQEYFSEEW